MQEKSTITIVKTESNILDDIKSVVDDNKFEIRVFGNLSKINRNMAQIIDAAMAEDSSDCKICSVLANVKILHGSIRNSLKESAAVLVVKDSKTKDKPGRLVKSVHEITGFNVIKYKVYESGTMVIFMRGRDKSNEQYTSEDTL